MYVYIIYIIYIYTIVIKFFNTIVQSTVVIKKTSQKLPYQTYLCWVKEINVLLCDQNFLR